MLFVALHFWLNLRAKEAIPAEELLDVAHRPVHRRVVEGLPQFQPGRVGQLPFVGRVLYFPCTSTGPTNHWARVRKMR